MEKIIKILEWITTFPVNGEDLFIVDVPDSDEFESQEEFMLKFFGGTTPHEIPSGKYLYYWRSDSGLDCVETSKETVVPDAEIESGVDYILLYKIA